MIFNWHLHTSMNGESLVHFKVFAVTLVKYLVNLPNYLTNCFLRIYSKAPEHCVLMQEINFIMTGKSQDKVPLRSRSIWKESCQTSSLFKGTQANPFEPNSSRRTPNEFSESFKSHMTLTWVWSVAFSLILPPRMQPFKTIKGLSQTRFRNARHVTEIPQNHLRYKND